MKDLYRLLRNLRNQERSVQPDASWVLHTRERLLMQVRNSMPTKEVAKKNRRYLSSLRPNIFKVLRGPLLATASILLVILGGSLMSVRAAEHALPGDVLYTVKLVTEQTRLALESSKAEKVRLKLEFTKRRVEDLKTIMNEPDDRQTERVNKATDILKQDLHTLKQQIEDTNNEEQAFDKDVLDSVKVVDKGVVEVAKALRQTDKTGLDSETRQKMNDAEAQASDVGLQALTVLVKARTEQDSIEITDEEISASLEQHTTVAQETVASVLALTSSSTTVTAGGAENAGTEVSSSSSSTASSTENGENVSDSVAATSAVATAGFAESAESALEEVRTMLESNRAIDAILKLKEVTAKTFVVQTELEKILSAASNQDSSSTSSTSSTVETVGSEESEESDSVTSTAPGT